MNQVNIYSANGLPDWQEGTAYKQPDPFVGLPSPNKGLSFPNSIDIRLSARKVSYSMSTLGQTTHTYTSPSYNDMVSLANYFADWSCNYEISEGPTHTFVVTCPWDTMTNSDFFVSLYASEQWELTPTMNVKPLLVNGLLRDQFSSPTVTGNYVVLPDVLKIAVQRALDNKTSLNIPSSSAYISFKDTANQTLAYLRGGIEGAASFTQTLKRSAVVDKNNRNNAFALAADITRIHLNQQGTVNYIMSTKDLISNYFIPTDTVGRLMNGSYCKEITLSSADPFLCRVWAGWLIKPPTFQFITRNKVQITQEFEWNEYPDGMYYVYSNPTDFGFPDNVIKTATS